MKEEEIKKRLEGIREDAKEGLEGVHSLLSEMVAKKRTPASLPLLANSLRFFKEKFLNVTAGANVALKEFEKGD